MSSLFTLVGHFCATLLMTLCIGGATITPYDPNMTSGVYFMGTQVGVYLDDTQPNQCVGAGIERQRWSLVIAGNAPGAWPQDQCSAATYNALEWGQYWGKPPKAQAYIIESSNLGPLTRSAPVLTRQTLSHHPRLLIFWGP
jgi:hypothetical protein